MAKQVKQVAVTTETTEAAVPAKSKVTFAVARTANFALSANKDAPEKAPITRTSKGENLKRLRVYGYDNGAGNGRVNKSGVIVLVPGTTGLPKGVTDGQWNALVAYAGKPVSAAYDGKVVTSRTVRRAYRAGFIRFV